MSEPVAQGSSHQYEDEIDLFEILAILFKQKVTIIASIILVTALTIAYALNIPSIYKAETVLIQPTKAQIHKLQVLNVLSPNTALAMNAGLVMNTGLGMNTGLTTGLTTETESMFNLFKRHINSNQTRKEVFNKNYELNKPGDQSTVNKKEYVDALSKSLSYSVLKTNKGGSVISELTLSFQHTNPQFSADVINQLVELANKKSLAELRDNFNSSLTFKKEELIQDIKLLRNKADLEQNDTIARLNEALQISKSAGATQTITSGNSAPPLHYRSAKSLSAEITELQKRKSNDPFIEGLREKQSELQKLNSLQLDTENVQLVLIDKEVIVPYQKIKPNRKLITVIGFMLGAMLGVFAALIKNTLEQHKISQRKET